MSSPRLGWLRYGQIGAMASPTVFVNIFAPGMLEMMVNNREQLAAHPEIGRAFEEYTRRRLAPMAAMFPEGMAMMRIYSGGGCGEGLSGVQPWEKSCPTIGPG